jgi:hypothetical protein
MAEQSSISGAFLRGEEQLQLAVQAEQVQHIYNEKLGEFIQPLAYAHADQIVMLIPSTSTQWQSVLIC